MVSSAAWLLFRLALSGLAPGNLLASGGSSHCSEGRFSSPDVPHTYSWLPLPMENRSSAVNYGVYRPDTAASDTHRFLTFRIGWMLRSSSVNNGGEALAFHRTLSIGILALNQANLTIVNASGAWAVRFEGHFYLYDDRETDLSEGDLQSELQESLAVDVGAQVVFSRFAWSPTKSTGEYRHEAESLGIMSFTWNGEAEEINAFTQRRYSTFYDMSMPNRDFAQTFLQQIAFASRQQPKLGKVAVVMLNEWWHWTMGVDAEKAATSLGLDIVFKEYPSWWRAWWSPGSINQTTGQLQESSEDKKYWEELLQNAADAGAGAIVYVGAYEVMSMMAALERLELNFEAVFTWWAATDRAAIALMSRAFEHTFTDRRYVDDANGTDPLYCTVGNYRDVMSRQFNYIAGEPKDALATIATVIYELIKETQSVDTMVMNDRMQSLSILNSLIGTIKFGLLPYNNGERPHLAQFGRSSAAGDTVSLNTVSPARFAQQGIRLPMPSWECRGERCICHPGWYTSPPPNNLSCSQCHAGKFTSAPGSTECTLASPGSHVPQRSATQQTPCPPGTFADRHGTGKACEPCPVGSSVDETGSEHCELCKAGSFSNRSGQITCTPCSRTDPRVTTLRTLMQDGVEQLIPFAGAAAESACGCRENSRMDVPSGLCVKCTEGMLCPGNGTQLIEPGHYAAAEEPGQIFRCFGDASRCSGGAPGACAEGRVGLTCATCRDQHLPGPAGTCVPCAGSHVAPFALFCIGTALTLGAFYFAAERGNRSRRNQTAVIVVTFASQLATVLQLAGVASNLAVTWPNPFRSFLSVLSVFAFDVKILQLSCVATLTAVQRFSTQLASMLTAGLCLILFHMADVLVRHNGQFRQRLPTLVAVLTTVALACLIPSLSTVLSPTQCIAHPNGLSTMVREQGVLCHQGPEHRAMMAMAFFTAAVPLFFVAWCCYAAQQLQHRLQLADMAFLDAVAGLFLRFRSRASWFAPVMVVRNALIAATPALPTIQMQVFCFQGLLVITVALVAWHRPYRVPYTSHTEVAINLLFLAIMNLCTVSAESRLAGQEAAGVFACIGFAAAVALTAPMLVFFAAKHAFRPGKPYSWFLCHHKSAAGALARLLHLELRARTPRKAFLDWEDLLDLDRLFSHVKEDIDMLVVLASEQVLTRPWCLGEVATACAHHIQMAMVPFASFKLPTAEAIDSLTRADGDMRDSLILLLGYGISLQDVQRAMECLATLPCIELPVQINSRTVPSLCIELMRPQIQQCSLSASEEPLHSTFAILADYANPEAVAAAQVLQIMLVQGDDSRKFEEIPQVFSGQAPNSEVPGDSTRRGAALEHLVAFNTNGCLAQADFLAGLLLASRLQCRIVPVIGEESFHLPGSTQKLLEQLRERALPGGGEQEELAQELTAIIANMFKEIAVTFNPAHPTSTERLLKLRAEDIMTRLTSMGQRSIDAVSTSKSSKASAPDSTASAPVLDVKACRSSLAVQFF